MLTSEVANGKTIKNLTVMPLIAWITLTDGTTISIAIGEDYKLTPMAVVNQDLQILERDK
jgi:hypothetical protein